MEEKRKEKRNWPIYAFLTMIMFLLIMILFSIYYFCSVFYSWAQYSLEKDGYFVQEESYDNTMINSTTSVNNAVD